MSGGSLDYVYGKVDDAAEIIMERASTPLQRAFASHLKRTARALKSLEWVYSSDKSPGAEEADIRAVVSPAEILASAAVGLREALATLDAARAAASGADDAAAASRG